ncbi:MAG: Methicillin resistance protein [Candidatus Moranbacteria bacterium GW2011_GWD2_36_12]|nr:MAG: Methicillin resistance protein [Candidatus Moranbacteria bacterium GW2011_GWD2_36_12]KKQ06726.1 MAG: Methicillin resistance protein [Candidatus Moranbacteria bacterium GW2011_GWE2_36_40]
MDKSQNKDNFEKEFLQSFQWKRFQESVGRRTHFIENDAFLASIVEHVLSIVGKYMYVPRGPILNFKFEILNEIQNLNNKIKNGMRELVDLGRKENAGWVRIEPESNQLLELIKENISEKIVKAPHDMQPKEIFVLDISKNEEQLLAQMKPKTRYNISLAKKKNVVIRNSSLVTNEKKKEYADAFLRLTKEMASRQGIVAHSQEYYRKMIEILPAEMLKIYVAQYDGNIIAANLVLFYENTVTYLHGASSNENRNVMAPFLLQWQTILDAKENGCMRYDFGGVRITNNSQQTTNNWEGITNFKIGFSPNTKPIEFPGSYDIIINPRKYAVYRGLQRAKAFAVKFRK